MSQKIRCQQLVILNQQKFKLTRNMNSNSQVLRNMNNHVNSSENTKMLRKLRDRKSSNQKLSLKSKNSQMTDTFTMQFTIGEKEHQDIIWKFVEENQHNFWNKKYLYKTLLLAVQEKPQNSILSFINQNFQEFKVDRYGNLLISALLEWIENLQQFNEFIQKLDLKKIQYHQHGCLIVIKLLNLINHKDPEVRVQITNVLNSLISQCIQLAQNQFGNYIIQRILELNLLEEKQRMLNEFLIPQFGVLARDKYGSNVCERMLYICTLNQFQTIWQNQIKLDLRFLLNDPFSNYVMQHFYYYTCRYTTIEVQFSKQILGLYRKMKLNQNGKMVYRFIYHNNNYDDY